MPPPPAVPRQEIQEPLLDKPAEGDDQAESSSWFESWWFVLVWIGLGQLWFMFWCKYHAITAAYLIIQIVTTIGYGDIPITDDATRVFLIIYVILTLLLMANFLTDRVEAVFGNHEETIRYFARKVEAKVITKSGRIAPSEKMLEKKYGKQNLAITYSLFFLLFIMGGTIFFRIYEGCTCGFGVTHVKGCIRGDQCEATGGQVKSLLSTIYMSVITLTTVGFGDLTPESQVGRIFSVPWMLFGVVAATLWMSKVVEGMQNEKKKARCLERFSKPIFDQIDTDKTGELGLSEFRVFCLLKFGMIKKQDLQMIDEMFKMMDQRGDKNGTVSRLEVEQYFDSTQSKRLGTSRTVLP